MSINACTFAHIPAGCPILEGDSLKLAVRRYGRPGPLSLVLIHGVTDSSHAWSPLVAAMTADIDTLAVDLRGHGSSPLPEDAASDCLSSSGYRLADYTGDILELLEDSSLRHVLLIGHSLGALIAQAMARSGHPKLIGVALLATTCRAVENPALVRIFKDDIFHRIQRSAERRGLAFPRDVYNLTLQELDAELGRWVVEDWCHDPQARTEWCREAAEIIGRLKIRTWLGAISGLLEMDTTSAARNLSIPILTAWGDRDDVFPERPDQQLLAACLGLAQRRHGLIWRRKIYPGAGHNLPWHVPDALARDLCAFATEVGGGARGDQGISSPKFR